MIVKVDDTKVSASRDITRALRDAEGEEDCHGYGGAREEGNADYGDDGSTASARALVM